MEPGSGIHPSGQPAPTATEVAGLTPDTRLALALEPLPEAGIRSV
jgi:hypothetical protein